VIQYAVAERIKRVWDIGPGRAPTRREGLQSVILGLGIRSRFRKGERRTRKQTLAIAGRKSATRQKSWGKISLQKKRRKKNLKMEEGKR